MSQKISPLSSGIYAHKTVYRSYTGYGRLVSEKVLGISRGSLIGRLFVNFFVFLMSGVVHAVVHHQIGLSSRATLRVTCTVGM